MNRKIYSMILIIALMVSALNVSFAAGREAVEQRLVWSVGGEPETLDPNLNSSNIGGGIINNMFEGLMREVNGKFLPAAAESYSVSEDKLTYTFRLRKDAKWSDGKPVTAYDFEYAWNRLRNESEYYWIIDEANVESYKAIDAQTFEVKLVYPTPYFIGMTAFYTFFPVREDAVASSLKDWSLEPGNAVSNGPFMLGEINKGSKIVLVKNEDYWNADSVKLEKIECLTWYDEHRIMMAYKNDLIHVVSKVPTYSFQKLRDSDPTLKVFPIDGVYFYSLNVNLKPLDDVRVRRALSLAVDRESIVERVTRHGQIPSSSIVSLVSLDQNGEVFATKHNYGIPTDASGVEEARMLLAEAGYPNGDGFPVLELKYNTSPGHKAIATAIMKMWKENLNIDVTLVEEEWTHFQETRRNGEFEIARSGWIGDFSDPMSYLNMFYSRSIMNYGNWSNGTYDSLIANSSDKSPEIRFNMLYQALDILMTESAVIPIYYYTVPVLISDEVASSTMDSRNLWYFGNAEIIKNHELN